MQSQYTLVCEAVPMQGTIILSRTNQGLLLRFSAYTRVPCLGTEVQPLSTT